MPYPKRWSVIVVGGGHAGCEAALACARAGLDTLLVTQNVDRIGWMSCNPAIGGVGKTHLVAEIDALGGEMARVTDQAGVHYKLLNGSKGPAVRALRVQCDKLAYATAMRGVVEGQAHLDVKQGDVRRLVLDGRRVAGVDTVQGLRFEADAVVVTAGTFLGAVCHTGEAQAAGGRAGDAASHGLGEQLRAAGVTTLRHKTGTCPRVDLRSIAWEGLAADPGLQPPPPLHRGGPAPGLPQMECRVTFTTARTHDLILANLHRSPLYGGAITGAGPRYCPSVEDKVVRFAGHDRHHVFLEREGWSTREVYLNGLSTSLPADVQVAMVRSLPGLEAAEIVRFGYAVEYDAVDARELGPDFALRALDGLWLAGQVNGTSGYEEAAGQGLWAALHIIARLQGLTPPGLTRANSYLGVMADDLVTHGAAEPYRMFTARAEHRLRLRPGNADLRLRAEGRRLGLVDTRQWEAFEARRERLDAAQAWLADQVARPDTETVAWLTMAGGVGLDKPVVLDTLLCRPELNWPDLAGRVPAWLWPGEGGTARDLDDDDRDEVRTRIRYRGYVQREDARSARARNLDTVALPVDLDFGGLGTLTAEAVAALTRVRPTTLGQASRVAGVTAAAVQALWFAVEGVRRRAG
ncbi:MAG: tRNA uridine-5-carboxymethylaminomethyl(34) synthesis enzyme MnmG [Myxococcales bacterium]|nr:tRNA uridine-5-carboxymethylaminomethyl(34) synthesis enzyme MnmG [Myxococcales bacterium]